MIDDALLKILVCPENRTSLRIADQDTVMKLNSAIAAGKLKNRAGEPVTSPLGGGLIREEGDLLYPIIDGIPVLLAEEAIQLEAFG